MPVLIDLDHQRLRGSITDFVAEARSRGRTGGGSLPGAVARLRAQLGQRVHAAYRRAAEREYGSAFTAELAVQLRRDVAGVAVHLDGRVDGVRRTAGVLWVEEVKSVSLPGVELRRAELGQFGRYRLQLRLYALALIDAGHEPAALRLRLILVSLGDGTRREFPVDIDPDGTMRRLAGMVRALFSAAQRKRRRSAMRRGSADAVAFPFAELRAHQGAFMAAVRRGLVEGRPVLAMAPTGLGKTIAALVPALRDALSRGRAVEFLTAKRTQRAPVARAFERVRQASGDQGRPWLAVTLRAKADMCPPGHLVCDAEVCPYLEGHASRREPAAAVAAWVERGGHIDAAEIYRVGVARRLCPFELALDLAAIAELVIADFNHRYGELLAPTSGPGEAVVVVDEAHNLGERARQQLSPRVRLLDVKLAQTRARMRAAAAPSRYAAQLGLGGPDSPFLTDCRRGALVRLLEELAVWAEAAAGGAASVVGGPLPDLARRSAAALLELAWSARRRGTSPRPDVVHEVLRAVVRVAEVAEVAAGQLEPHVYGAVQGTDCAVGMVCLDPAPWLRARHRALHRVVAMSATFFPLPHHARALGLDALDPVRIETPSPFPDAHRQVVVVPGIDTTYRRRAAHHHGIAEVVGSVAAVRPGKYAAFFSSFAFLGAVLPHLQRFPGLVLSQAALAPLAERQRLIAAFREHDGPALLVAVTGGALAEGLDFPGEELVGAFIVGPALPPVDAERERISAYFQRRSGDGFAQAYLRPGMQRVVQAAGRVIRSDHDRGIIVLIGQRFAREPYARCLPRDWYDRSPQDIVASDPVAVIRRFWARSHRIEADAHGFATNARRFGPT
ncbi:MAG: ATP-dependent DNA helicase [Myxococcales bacterium FL481]|nr:MAG: ATP-dependent DNA helicase [Myxococcales bacterium FL481]